MLKRIWIFVMVRIVFAMACVLATGGTVTGAGRLYDRVFFSMRSTHPGLFVEAEDIFVSRERAAGPEAERFRRMREYVSALPDDAPIVMMEDRFVRLPDGTTQPDRPNGCGRTLFRYNDGQGRLP